MEVLTGRWPLAGLDISKFKGSHVESLSSRGNTRGILCADMLSTRQVRKRLQRLLGIAIGDSDRLIGCTALPANSRSSGRNGAARLLPINVLAVSTSISAFAFALAKMRRRCRHALTKMSFVLEFNAF